MITNISLWAKEIAIAVIICTLILMIIPNNKNKKYIKVIAGIYILFCVLNPITSRAIDINEYKLDNYISESNEQNKTEETYKLEKAPYYAERILNLPSGTQITKDEIEYVVEQVKNVLGEFAHE